MRRVLSLETLHVNDSGAVTKRGTKQLFDYQHMCTVVTAVKDTASDAGKKLYYQFNDSGNVVAMRDELGYGQFVKFEAGVDNKPSEVSKLRKVVINQLRKIDFASQWTGSGSAVKDSSTRCLGLPSVKLTGNTNGGSYYQQSVTLLPNQTYTFSAYVKTEDVQGGTGAFLRLVSADGWTQADSEPVTGSTPAAIGNEMPADGWQRIKLTYEHASNVEETFNVRLMLDATAGTAWFRLPAVGDRHGGQLRQPPEPTRTSISALSAARRRCPRTGACPATTSPPPRPACSPPATTRTSGSAGRQLHADRRQAG